LKVGHLVAVRLASVNQAVIDAFKALKPENALLTKFPVIAVGHTELNPMTDDYDFIEGPDENGLVWACQYLDLDVGHTTAVDPLDCPVDSRNQGLWFDTATGWTSFLFNVRQVRSMFLAGHYPIACWHGTDMDHYAAAQQHQYRLETYFHSLLHGENRRIWYNAQSGGKWQEVEVGGLSDAMQREAERKTFLAMRELDIVCPYKEVSPLSLNHELLSIRHADYVISGASLPGNKRLFRVTLRDEQLVASNGTARLHDKIIGPIGTSEEHADFRTVSGRVLRLPGQVVPVERFAELAGSETFCSHLYPSPDAPPDDCEYHEGSWFTDFGWWVEVEAS
jgi:hypothetical protein